MLHEKRLIFLRVPGERFLTDPIILYCRTAGYAVIWKSGEEALTLWAAGGMITVSFVMRVFLSPTVLSVFCMIHWLALANAIPCFY